MKLSGLLVLAASAGASAKAVFAHFMVGNVAKWSAKQWESDIALAQSAHIDAFALNIAANEPHTSESLDLAFSAAASRGFKLFFSFDYAGNGPFDQSDVISYINKYAASSAYFRHNGKPFVSTFEGPLNAADWVAIKAATGCFFVPDWSSEGAKAALALVPGVPDGLFSWAAWPWGDRDSNTYTDASYLQYLNDTGTALPYMMPVSPWFYTNLPGYNKNWLWRGDDLWYDRWEEAIWVQPDFIEIISWNDYGESHYIGPLHDDGFDAFSVGKGPYNFAEDMPHDGWRQILPFVIDTYKNGIATVTEESITAWYRLTAKDACSDGDTTGNTASQLQVEFMPNDVVQDKIFYSALLSSAKQVTVTVGGVDLGAKWTHTPSDSVGIYHGSVAFGGHTGPVKITVGGMVFTGESITTSCNRATGQNGLTNFNAWVGSQVGAAVRATPSLTMSEQVCVEGTGAAGFSELCEFTCQYSYCPIGACYCTKMGPQKDLPTKEDSPKFGTVGYPAAGKSADYSGLCEYACNYGFCPEQYCSTISSPLVTPLSSPFDPPACTSGTGSGDLGGLCSFACNFGYCPIHSCNCDTQGALHEPPAQTKPGGSAAEGKDKFLYDGLCEFACSRGYCPPAACQQSESEAEAAYIGRDVYVSHNAQCEAPCVMVLPPSALDKPTTISISPYTTSLEVAVPKTSGGSTFYAVSVTTITLSPPPITTTEIPFSNVEITTDARNGFSFQPTPSIVFPPIGYPITIVSEGTSTVTTRSVTLPPWPFVGAPVDPAETTTKAQNPDPTGGESPPDSTSTSAVVGVLPVWKTWPPGVVTPVTDDIEDIGPVEDETGTSVVFPCNIWFMNLCTDNIRGWKLSLPKGVIGPGPPPRGYFDLPGWDFPKPLPPWPKITIGTNGYPTYSDEPACETVSASLCSTTTSYGLSAAGQVTKTTATTVTSTCETVYGCSVSDYDSATATAVCSNPPAKRQATPRANTASATSALSVEPTIVPRQNDDCEDQTADTLIYMKWKQWSDAQVAPVVALLEEHGMSYKRFRTDGVDGGYTAFLHVDNCPESLRQELGQIGEVGAAFDYIEYQRQMVLLNPGLLADAVEDAAVSANWTAQKQGSMNELWARGTEESFAWHLSQVSTPKGINWEKDQDYTFQIPGKDRETHRYYFEGDNPGEGQFIYIMEAGIDEESVGLKYSFEVIELPKFGPTAPPNNEHGTIVAACAANPDSGIAQGAKVILVETGSGETEKWNTCYERYLAGFLSILDDVRAKGRQGKSVINLSASISAAITTPFFLNNMAFMFLELQKLGVSIVTSAGNKAEKGKHCDDYLPQRLIRRDVDALVSRRLRKKMRNLIVVGATDEKGLKASFSETFRADKEANELIVYAPGEGVLVPVPGGGFEFRDGTSYAAPMVAGLIAYWRGMESNWAPAFTSATAMPKLARDFMRRLGSRSTAEDDPRQLFAWNGQVKDKSCLTNGMLADDDGNLLCPESLQVCDDSDKRKRQSCALPDPDDGDDYDAGSGSSGSDSGLRPSPITWQPGTPSPTCSSNCGSLCSGYWCKPNPTGNPPDYSDPILHPVTSVPSHTTSAPHLTTSVPTATSKPAAAPSVDPRVPSRDARWDLFHMAVTLDSGGLSYTWVGNEDDQSQPVETYLENHSKCNNPDWMGADKNYPAYPASMDVTNFFGAHNCKFVFQVGSQSEWLGLDSGEWLGNVICSEYDYAECFKDTDKTFYSCDDLDATRTRWAYCTWDHWFTKVNTRTAALSRLAAIRKLTADNETSRLGLELDGSLSVNMTSPAANGTANLRFL